VEDVMGALADIRLLNRVRKALDALEARSARIQRRAFDFDRSEVAALTRSVGALGAAVYLALSTDAQAAPDREIAIDRAKLARDFEISVKTVYRLIATLEDARLLECRSSRQGRRPNTYRINTPGAALVAGIQSEAA
jgi:DNA-binding MarR family transcriptional regulator